MRCTDFSSHFLWSGKCGTYALSTQFLSVHPHSSTAFGSSVCSVIKGIGHIWSVISLENCPFMTLQGWVEGRGVEHCGAAGMDRGFAQRLCMYLTPLIILSLNTPSPVDCVLGLLTLGLDPWVTSTLIFYLGFPGV